MTNSNTVGLAMIVKNEEANLPAFLENIQGIFDQVVIVDTGSEDSTLNLLHNSKSENDFLLFQKPWADDFSDARNFSFSKLKTDFIVWLDADDRLTEGAKEFILSLKKGDLADHPEGIHTKYAYFYDNNPTPSLVLKRLQMVKRSAGPVWLFTVFEQLTLRKGSRFIDIDGMIHHLVKESESDGKARRNVRILEQSLQAIGDNVHDLFFLGMSHYSKKDYSSAIGAIKRLLNIEDQDVLVQLRLLQCLYLSNLFTEFQTFYEKYPVENTVLRGFYLELTGKIDEAAAFYQNPAEYSQLSSDLFSREEQHFWLDVFPLQRLVKIYSEKNDVKKIKELKLKLLSVVAE